MMESVLSGLSVRTPQEETRGGGLPGHHDHQPGHAEGQQGGLSAGQENVIQNTVMVSRLCHPNNLHSDHNVYTTEEISFFPLPKMQITKS